MRHFFFLLIYSFINLSFAQVNSNYINSIESIKFTNIEQELSKQWVSSIIQDQDGFMWFATQDGLYRYDGNKFLTYRYNPLNSNSLPANWVRTIAQDKDGFFWLGTQGEGLVRFDQKNNTFKQLKSQKQDGINSAIVYNIFITSTNAIWVVGDDGVYRKPKNKSKFIKINDKSIDVSFNETELGEEIIFLDNTLYKFNKITNKLDLIEDIHSKAISIYSKKITVYKYNKKLITNNFEENLKLTNASEKIWNISNMQNDICILIGNNHIYKFSTQNDTIKILNHDIDNFNLANVNTLYFDKQNILWIGTKKGLYKENKASKVFLETIPLHARRIVIDNKDTYIGGQDGLNLYSEKNKTYKNFSKEKIFSVLKGKNGIWAGDIFGTLYFINKEYKLSTYKLEKEEKQILKIYGLAEDSNGFLWVSSWNAIYVLNQNGKVLHKFKFKNNTINIELKAIQIHIDKQENLWVLTVGNGLFIIPKITQISNGKNPFTYKQYKHIDNDSGSLNSDVLYEIHEDKQGVIWIGSDFGINKYKPENDNFEALSIEQTLFDKKVMAIETDDKGLLWINTIKDGIFIYNQTSATIIDINENDGLLSNSGLFTSSTFENEKMYFGTDKGVQIINPKNFSPPFVNKTPVITKLNIFGEDAFELKGAILNKQNIALNHKQTDITIEFSLHDYRFPQKVNYYYRLKNSHIDWRKAKNNTVSYTNLIPGDYDFMVKASYRSLSENSIATMHISIASPWHKTIWAYITYIFALGLMLFLFLFLKFKQQITQHKLKALKTLNISKSKFFSNVSHEFRTPLTLISGPIQKQLNKENLDDDERDNLEMMQRNTNRLLRLVNQLLYISKIESGTLSIKVSKNKILPFIRLLTESFNFSAKQKQINYISNFSSATIDTWFDKDVLEKIIVNLLSNAFKYTPNKGSITCNAYIVESQLHFEVNNTGKGISKNEVTKIFNRFHQLDENKQGFGIGLSLVQELVNLHKGIITVDSEPDKWTTFYVKLPINKNAFNDKELIKNSIKESNAEIIIPEINVTPNLEIKDSENPILLIVEDNLEVRSYINSIFINKYAILLAKNGQEGIDLAKRHIPDIIISDIMMPIKNGIELCNILKTDELTSHIPIILLTAKVGDENKLEGIKTGADDYITKPFNNELLKLKVEKLIENIKKLQQKFSQEIILKPKDIAVNTTDELFLERVKKVLDDNLIESTFNSEGFCKAVGMSRMQLHRKLKALLGMSTSEFIRSQRLKLAAELLKKSDVNVSQIGYSVGFNDHAYFTKRFKEIYNCTPTEYISKFNK